jgi:uncharacterized protein YecT (DUF1311 family)
MSPNDVYSQCIDRSSTNAEFSGCGEVYLRRLEDALNFAWKKAYASLDDGQSRSQLLEEQRAWINFKEKSCQFWTIGSAGREGQALHSYGCRGAIIDARISDLNSVYDLTHQDELPAR